jgi:hypothetical protein
MLNQSRLRAGRRRPLLNGVFAARVVAALRTGLRGDHVLSNARRMQSIGWTVASLLALLMLTLPARNSGMVAIVRRAAAIPDQAEGLEGFVNAANALISPALVAMAAVAPLGCVVGAGALMFGSRRGMVIIGASLGTLIFLGSVKGIVA